ncbi:hypothetical protein AB0K15_15595 [Amycolatopsis sp. NPDC049253]|uniref:hypothetical protein n=1 Tax=Amycolatopsis sp. NPDC049253 TaxID=3155274 RepID=UPI00342B8296
MSSEENSALDNAGGNTVGNTMGDAVDEVAAEDLTQGQWFWHVPVPGLAGWPLQVATAELLDDAVRIITTDEVRELVSYARDRRVRLAAAS